MSTIGQKGHSHDAASVLIVMVLLLLHQNLDALIAQMLGTVYPPLYLLLELVPVAVFYLIVLILNTLTTAQW